MCILGNLAFKVSDVLRKVIPTAIWPGVASTVPLLPVAPTGHLHVGKANVSIRVRWNSQALDSALALRRGSLAHVAAHWHLYFARERPGTTRRPQASTIRKRPRPCAVRMTMGCLDESKADPLAHSLCDETSGALQSGRWTRTMTNTSTLGHLRLISALGWVVAEPSMWAVRCLGETQLACWSAISRVAVQRHGASEPTARNVVPHMTSKTVRDAEGSRSDYTSRLATHDIASSPWAHRAPSSTRSSTRNPLASEQASRFLLQGRTHPDQGPSPFQWGRKNYARLFPRPASDYLRVISRPADPNP